MTLPAAARRRQGSRGGKHSVRQRRVVDLELAAARLISGRAGLTSSATTDAITRPP